MTFRDVLSTNLKVPQGKLSERSRHYKAWVGQTFDGIVKMVNGEAQKTRTTVHHIVKRGISKKGPDWWTIPVSKKRHVHGAKSIDKLGKEGFREEWGLPPYEPLALVILSEYLKRGAYEQTLHNGDTHIDPRPIDRRSAAAYFEILKNLINDGKRAHGWTWDPPERTADLRR
jgi:hypothetical protein